MPELPEVETVASELRKLILNKQLDTFEALWSKSFQNETDFEITGQKIVSIGRQGKYLLITLSETYLIIHLRMTGQLIFCEDRSNADLNGHTRVLITFSDRSVLLFKDVRKFGRIIHVSNIKDKLAHVGIDALDERVTKVYFEKLLMDTSMNIKSFFLSQKFVSGMGNIYTDEVLFLAKTHPSLPANQLKKKQRHEIYHNMNTILLNSIQNMGSSISDYRDPSGKEGTNQNYFYVYGRNGLPCKKCGGVIEKIRFAGRGTHFCPKCQKVKSYQK